MRPGIPASDARCGRSTLHSQLPEPATGCDRRCSRRRRGCAAIDWTDADYFDLSPTRVRFLARTGAKLQGHVWGLEHAGERPGVVITTGSIQASDQMYWWAARALAAAGYVVLTYDVQCQGQSETFSHAPGDPVPGTTNVPSQQAGNFHDGTVDAMEFLLSTPEDPYVPVGWSDEDVDIAERSGLGAFDTWVEAGLDSFVYTGRGETPMSWSQVPYTSVTTYGVHAQTHYTIAWLHRWVWPDAELNAAAHERLLNGPLADPDDPSCSAANYFSVRAYSGLRLSSPEDVELVTYSDDLRHEYAGLSAIGDWAGADQDTAGRVLP